MAAANALSPEFAANLAHNLALERELSRLCATLERAGIPVVVLKGIPLLRRLGLSLAERPLADNDLLVHVEHVPAAARLLAQEGYRDNGRLSLELSLATGHEHEMVRIGPWGRQFVDLHWNAFSPLLFGVQEDLVWSHSIPWAGAYGISVLDPPMTLVHTAAHYVQHFLNEPRLLKILGREWELWRGEIDTARLILLARETNTLHALDFCLGVSAMLEYGPPPPHLGSWPAAFVRTFLHPLALLERSKMPRVSRLALGLLLLSPSRAASTLRRLAVPPRPLVEATLGDMRTSRVAVHYLRRPLRAVSRWLQH